MKKLLIILAVIILIASIGFVGLGYYFGPLSKAAAEQQISTNLEKFIEENQIDSTLLRIYAPQKDIDFSLAVGNAQIDSRYHSASIGKTLTATLIYMLEEKAMLNIDAPLANYLAAEYLDKLFLYEGVDYKNQVTIRMLLNHTSGVGDYFLDATKNGQSFLDIVERDMDRIWTPLDLLQFTQNNQQAVGKPAEKFHYSDTSYILLGLVVESVTKQSFFEAIKSNILDPMGMENSTMDYLAEKGKILPLIINDVDYKNKNALSIDWSGGGLITTTEDMLKFMLALHNEQLISAKSLDKMKKFDLVFQQGLYYGEGMVQFRLGELNRLLSGMGNLYGGMGLTGVYMFTNDANDIYMIMNIGDAKYIEQGVEELINILMLIDRIE